jgi:periplasmic copper chaperone A
VRIFFSVISILVSFAFATQAAAIEIVNPVALTQPDTAAPGAIGLTIVNKAGADKLVSTKTPVAKIAQIHNNKIKRGKMRMRRKSGLQIGANTVTTLKTDGLHIMLMGLKSPLKAGMTFPLTLNFENAGTVEVTVTVQ